MYENVQDCAKEIDPIGEGILGAIMGPPEMKEIIKIVHQLSFLYKRCKGDNV